MKLLLERFYFGDRFTIGRLFVDEEYFGFTLEDQVREKEGVPVTEWKIAGETAIPKGLYRVIIDHSEHFNRDLPHLLDVPGFDGVRIHPGNTDKDTEGCILVGRAWSGGDFIHESREAFETLFEKIKLAESREIEIT